MVITKTKKGWLLFAFVLLGAFCLFSWTIRLGSSANAGAEPQANIDGRIMVVPVQVSRDSYGIAMIDTVGQTLWLYEISSRGSAVSRLRLAAARSWKYDKLLQQYNTDEPRPEQVKKLLESLGQRINSPGKKNVENIEPEKVNEDIIDIAVPDGNLVH